MMAFASKPLPTFTNHRRGTVVLFALSAQCMLSSFSKPGANPAVLVAQEATKQWEFAAGGTVNTIPTVGPDGTVYFGCADQKLYALDGTSGEKKWEYKTWAPLFAHPEIGKGGLLYVGSAEGFIYALDARSGEQRWIFKVPRAAKSPEEMASDQPDAAHPRTAGVYSPAVGPSGVLYAWADGVLYAIDAKNGRKAWETEIDAETPTVSPSGRTIYTKVRGRRQQSAVLALDPADGSVRWRIPIPPANRGRFLPGLRVGPNGTLYAALHDNGDASGTLYALGSDGRKKWQFQPGKGRASHLPAFGREGALYCSTANVYQDPAAQPAFVYALDAANGSVRWSVSPGPKFLSSPVIAQDGTLTIRHESGLTALSPKDGHTRWTYSCGEGTAPAISADGTLYFGEGSKLIALRPALTAK